MRPQKKGAFWHRSHADLMVRAKPALQTDCLWLGLSSLRLCGKKVTNFTTMPPFLVIIGKRDVAIFVHYEVIFFSSGADEVIRAVEMWAWLAVFFRTRGGLLHTFESKCKTLPCWLRCPFCMKWQAGAVYTVRVKKVLVFSGRGTRNTTLKSKLRLYGFKLAKKNGRLTHEALAEKL